MRLFRSEEHARHWGAAQGLRFDVLTLAQAADLARDWYAHKLEPGWRRHTPDEARALFERLKLDPEFWRLA